ncbi:hypothetical protein AltI4_00750 [Alteromonas sp. I4]|nr:hypothetical protein AltI4_00750 [Alteromonas sp. I4]
MSIEGHILKGPIADIYSVLKGQIKKKLPPDPEKVYQKGLKVCFVKTIWQTDRAVDLNNFYYPSKLLIDDDKVLINSLADIPPRERIIVQGTAGQGKSIFLRYLSGRELKIGKKIPLFIELMKVSDKYSLQKLIISSMSEMGFKATDGELELFLSTAKFCLLLDAFDELPKEHVKDTLSFIEFIATKYPEIQIVITSRPNSDIQNSALFSVYDLAPLGSPDFEPILGKFYEGNQPEVHKIISYLKNEAQRISELITTPLLLTLLCITYNSTNKIPPTPFEFYQKLFYLLAERHDSTKPGFRREFASKLTINKLEKLFEAFCFYCMQSDSKAFSRTEAQKKVGDAIRLSDITPHSESSFLDDCVRNTCLLLKEGFDFQFIHKSVMEFHAASFISSANSELKLKFYKAAVAKSYLYSEQLHYLSYIDQDFYERNYVIPTCELVLEKTHFDGKSCSLDIVPDEIEVWFSIRGQKIMLRKMRNILNRDLPELHNNVSFCTVEAIQEFLEEFIDLKDGALQLPMDNSTAFYSDFQNMLSNGRGNYFGVNINPHENQLLTTILKKYIIAECDKIAGNLAVLKNKLSRRDEEIESLEF